MGLTTIPTEVDGSLGRDKVDVSTPPNLANHAPSGEYNVLKKAVAEMAAAIGLAAGTTAGSLEMLKLALNDPAGARPNNFAFLDQFLAIDTDQWTVTTSGGASATVLDGETAPANAADGGLGIAKLDVQAGGTDFVSLLDKNTPLNGGHSPVLRARVRTPADFAKGALVVGFSDNANIGSAVNYAYMKAVATGWDLASASSDGGSSDSDSAAGSAPTVNTWYDLRIEIDADSEARFYVDDTLIGTLDAANSAPNSNDKLGRYASLESLSTNDSIAYVDYLDVRGSLDITV